MTDIYLLSPNERQLFFDAATVIPKRRLLTLELVIRTWL
jgi:hypothetical protein